MAFMHAYTPGWIAMILIISTGSSQVAEVLTRGCQAGFFRCGNTTQCLAQQYWCDTSEDCENGEDELFDACYYTAPGVKAFFTDHVPLGRNNKANICVLPYYPSSCTCLYNDRLKCQMLGLDDIPAPLSSNITILMLQQNHIELSTNMFYGLNMTKLRYLYLSENEIHTIPNGTFEYLPKLYNLDLAANRIRRLKAGMFSGLDNLSILNIGGNRISHIEDGTWLDTPDLMWLRLDFNHLVLDDVSALEVPLNLYWLHLEGNFINTIGANMFARAANVRDLLLKNNDIRNISNSAFANLRDLESLDLSFNKIHRLPEDVFSANDNLDDLSIGNNPMTTLPLNLFQGLNNISRLKLDALIIHNIHQSMFDNLRHLKYIKLSSFQYCRYAKYVRDCSPKGDGLSTFSDLLASPVLRILIWIVAIVTVSGNMTVLISRLIIKEQHKAHSMFLRNLSASDLLMGVYLFIIAAQDVRMRDIFNHEALDWISSRGCQVTGVLAMISCEVSVLLLAFMTTERFLAVVYPLKKKRLSFAKSLMWVSTAWVLGMILSVFPLFLGDSIGNFYGSNAVCFPLHIHDPYRKGWQYSAFLFLGVNFVTFFTIAILYTIMMVNIMKTRQQAVGQSMRLDMVVVRRFTLIVLTDALCWIPIAVIKICALWHVPMLDDVHSWLTVLIVPINSALNPMIYSMSTPSFFVKLKQSFKSHNSHGSQSSQSYRAFQRENSAVQPINHPVPLRECINTPPTDIQTEAYYIATDNTPAD